MSVARWIRRSAAGGLAAGILCPAPLLACAACFGQSDDAMAKGMNMGILALLLVVTFVLGGIGAFGIYLARRAARFAEAATPVSAPPPAGATEMGTAADFDEPLSQLTK